MVKIIAEAGSTHKGDPALAEVCAKAAVEAGADAVKFMMSDPDELIADKTMEYEGDNLYAIIKGYQLPDEAWPMMVDYCDELDIEWYATVGTANYVPLAERLGMPRYKIGGWCCRNYYLFDAISETGKPIEIDVGAVIDGEIVQILDRLERRGPRDITLIYESHGRLNLRSIPYLAARFGRDVGYSSNSGVSGYGADNDAMTLGACSIEKRIKPDDLSGHHRDRALNPVQFSRWASSVREADAWMGRFGLYPPLEDIAGKQRYFTSLHFSRDVEKGEIVTRDMLCARRPGSGLGPQYDYLFLGRPLARDVKENEIVTYDTCEGVTE